MVIEEMVGGQHHVDERKRAEPLRVILINRSSTERRGRAPTKMCARVGRKKKKLLQRPASLEMPGTRE